MIDQAIQAQIKAVFEAVSLREDAVVLLCVDPHIEKRSVKPLLDAILSFVNEGSLVIVGDCTFNTSQSDITSIQKLSNRERLVLAADYPLQLLSLHESSIFAKHPSLSMAGVGKIARYLFRHSHLDFPYEKPSVFSDLEDLNALYVCVGTVYPKTPLKLAYAKDPHQVVRKESCVFNGEVLSYLDFECNYDAMETALHDAHILEPNDSGPLTIRVGWYRDVLNVIRESVQ